MTGCHSLFSTYTPCSVNLKIKIADGSLSLVAGKESIFISKYMKLQSVLHVPKLTCNLISVSKLSKDLNGIAKFSSSQCEFRDLYSGKTISNTKERDGLYFFEDKQQVVNKQAQALSNESLSVSNKIMLWYNRLGHPSFPYLKKLFPSLFRNKNINSFRCETCQFAKHTSVPHPVQLYKSSKPFSLIHSDIWGPSRVNNITWARWFITFIDDHTRTCWVFLLKEKSDAESTFKQFRQMIKTQFQTQIQILRTDNGREYFNSIRGQYLINHGIFHQSSCVGKP